MAESDYRRLEAACHCGAPIFRKPGPGRDPRACADHRGRSAPPRPSRPPIECPACRGVFVPKNEAHYACSVACRRVLRRKPRAESARCLNCGKHFTPSKFVAGVKVQMYCTKKCKQIDWRRRTEFNERRRASSPPKTICAYRTGHCSDCACGLGARRGQLPKRCGACAKRAANEAARIGAEALHRAAGRVKTCSECGASFCPLYGSSGIDSCAPCWPEAERRRKRMTKGRREARERGVDAESIDPFKVFERDRWRCQLCGIRTPRSKRGTYDDDAPELDHIVPLSQGGPHTYTNTQCACRRCNGLKGDRPLGQMLLIG